MSSFSFLEPKVPPLAIKNYIVYLVRQKSCPNPSERLFHLKIKNNLLYLQTVREMIHFKSDSLLTLFCLSLLSSAGLLNVGNPHVGLQKFRKILLI